MDYLEIHNWDKWQSYRKDRDQPPWIKIHRRLMRNPEWVSLSDSERGQLIAMWLLAADHNGVIPASQETIQKLCYMDNLPNINKFIDLGFIEDNGCRYDASTTSARRQDDSPEENRREENRREEKDMQVSPALLFPLKDGTEYPLELAKISEYEKTYRNIEIPFELKKCLQWNIDNKDKRKTERGILKHINHWLSAASQSKGPGLQPGIEYDNTAVEEARRDAKELTPEQRAKNIARIKALAEMVGKREGR